MAVRVASPDSFFSPKRSHLIPPRKNYSRLQFTHASITAFNKVCFKIFTYLFSLKEC